MDFQQNKIETLGVFCGSSSGSNPAYIEAAKTLGRVLAEQEIKLVYGGGNIGMMGAIADACLAAGGEITGVITTKLRDVELAHVGVKDMRVVETMAERKSLIEEMSDAFIAMPGGYGTFDELFQVITLMQLNIMQKPIGLLNVEDYFVPLLAMIRKGIEERFVRPEHEGVFAVHHEGEQLLALLRNMTPVETRKWLDEFKEKKF